MQEETGRGRPLQLGRALRLVWQSGPGLAVASGVLLVVQALLPLLSLYLLKLLIDAVTRGTAAADKAAAFQDVLLYVVLTGLVTLATAVAGSLAGIVSEAQTQAITDRVHDLLHAKCAEVDLASFENPAYYDILHRAQQEAPYRPANMVRSMVQVAQSGISLLAMTGLLLTLHWAVMAALFVSALPGILVRVRFSGQAFRWQKERTQEERRAWYFSRLLTADIYAKEIRLFRLGQLFREQFLTIRLRLRKERLRISGRRATADALAQVFAAVPILAAFAFIARQTILGAVSLGGLVMYFQAFQRGQGALREISNGLSGLYEDGLFLTSFHELLDLQPQVTSTEGARPFPVPIREGIVLEGVSFVYPGTDRLVLEDVSFSIRPGEKIALVGRNGSGKTTLVKLLLRLYDPTSGRITVDGEDLRDLDAEALRRAYSVVLQDYACYNLSARDNIRFGNTEALDDTGKVEEAARKGGAEEIIRRLPRGYDTVLGRWFEDGEQLSTGQWQKVALSRAFMRDAQVLVLDEPTSSMDPLAEFEVFQRILSLAEDRTTILVSHRLSTVRMVDRIYVMDEGHIIECGTHDALMEKQGSYAELFETQAQYYR